MLLRMISRSARYMEIYDNRLSENTIALESRGPAVCFAVLEPTSN